MNRIIIIVVASIVIVGSGGAVWYFFSNADVPAVEGEVEAKSPEGADFVEIKNLSISVIRDGQVDHYITISLSLEMHDKDAKTHGDESFPRLKDAIFRDLHSYFSMQKAGQLRINVAQVKSRLMWAAERAIGKGKVKQIIIQGAYERKGKFK